MKFTLKDKNNNTLFTGTKQECMHFIKCRKLNRQEIKLESFKTDEPAVHYTSPIEEVAQIKKPFYKRLFSGKK